MHCISLHQPYAELVAMKIKRLETRKFRTSKIGQRIAIVSTLKPADPELCRRYGLDPEALDALLLGVLRCTVRIVRVRPCTVADEAAACCVCVGKVGWELDEVDTLAPFKVRGFPGFFNVHDDTIALARATYLDAKAMVE
jgi:hypothetical protein